MIKKKCHKNGRLWSLARIVLTIIIVVNNYVDMFFSTINFMYAHLRFLHTLVLAYGWGWSGGKMVLDNFKCRAVLIIWIIVGVRA